MNSACVMLTKSATEGAVKTRIGKVLGHSVAAKIHHILTEYTVKTVMKSNIPLFVSFMGDLNSPLARSISETGAQLFQQTSGTLGEKIHHAFNIAPRCVIIGSDCPWLTPTLLEQAIVGPDIVLGPAEDGGYYLIAATSPPKSIFEDISWSTDLVLQQTLEQCQRLNFPVHQLPMLYDIDTHRDLLRALQSNLLPPTLHSQLLPYA